MRRMLIVVMLLTGVVAVPRAAGADAPHEVAPDATLRDPGVEVFMHVHATVAQVATVRAAILRDGAQIHRFAHLTKEDSYQEFARIFKSDPDLLAKTKPADLPESFRLELQDNVNPRSVRSKFGALPGVDEIVIPSAPTRAQQVRALDTCENAARLRRAYDSNTVLIFLGVDATHAQISTVRAAIQASPLAKRIVFLDHGAALDDFRQLFHRHPKLIRNTLATDLPESFRISVVDRASVKPFVAAMRRLPDVNSVSAPVLPDAFTQRQCGVS